MSNMRGLTVFISDLRNARARDLEEKRINTELAKIRAKFKDSKLTGYDRKKYICKLLYMYVLGWNVDFGHLEAVKLISSSKFSEKQVGYLGVTLFLNEHHSLLHLVVNSMRNDLLSDDELHNCLALHCIANIGGKEIGEALSLEIFQLLVSPNANNFVKKKASLTLLRLMRKSPGIIQRPWKERLVSMLDDPDIGVALSVSSLVLAIVVEAPELWSDACDRAIHRLKRISVNIECESEYIYYTVACPWLQINLMKIIGMTTIPQNALLHSMLVETLQHIIEAQDDSSKNIQQNNAQNAVLFDAINLAVQTNLDSSLVSKSVRLLGRFLSSKETNVRYLALETMAQLAARMDIGEPLRKNQHVVLLALKDRDVSVRRRALDLLYTSTDVSSAKQVVNELIRVLQASEYSLRSELVLKTSILVEKFATDHTWYLDTMLQLLSIAGDQIAGEVWQRVIQVVTNNEALQEHAVRSLLDYLKAPACHENLVKVGAYLLGEFGHLIANEDECSPIHQFSACHARFNEAGTSTRSMLLSTYIKFVNIFPEIKSEILLVFEQLSGVLEPELQQRACEYRVLATMASDELLQAVCEEMPVFPERQSALLATNSVARLEARKTDVLINHGLETLNIGDQLTPGWEAGYLRLLWKNDGLLYEDGQIQIGARSEYHNTRGKLILYYGNKSGSTYSSFKVNIHNGQGLQLVVDAQDSPSTTIEPKAQVQQVFELRCLDCFHESPLIQISYLAGSSQSINLKLPVALHKFMEPAPTMSKDDFAHRWARFGELAESRHSIRVTIPGNHFDLDRLKNVIAGHRWQLLSSETDQQSMNAAGVLHSEGNSESGILLKAMLNVSEESLSLVLRGNLRSAVQHIGGLMASGHLAHGMP